nr:acetyl-coA carboxylase beta subunit [Echinodorus paniculatus]
MKEWLFRSMSLNEELERRCGLNKSMYSRSPIGHTRENGALLRNHRDKNISSSNASGSCPSSHIEHLFVIKGIAGLISDDLFLVRDSNGDSYPIYFAIDNPILRIDNAFLNEAESSFSNFPISNYLNSNSRSKGKDHYYYQSIYDKKSSWKKSIISWIASYLCFEVNIHSSISEVTVNSSDSNLICNESPNSSMTASANENPFNGGGGACSNDPHNGGASSDDPDRKKIDYSQFWVQCETCYELNYKKLFKSKMYICESCGSHVKMNSSDRIELLVDPGTWYPINEDIVSTDPIEFDFKTPLEVDFRPRKLDSKPPLEVDFRRPIDEDDEELDFTRPSELDFTRPSELDFKSPMKWVFKRPLDLEQFGFEIDEDEIEWSSEDEIDEDEMEWWSEDEIDEDEIEIDEDEMEWWSEDEIDEDEIEWSSEDEIDEDEMEWSSEDEDEDFDPQEFFSKEENEFDSEDEEDESYRDRLDSYQRETGLTEAVQTGIGELNGVPIAIGVMDFEFIGGSMGSVVGEKIARLIEYATIGSLPLIIACASGGARMQEGSLSLMQMAKISSALYHYRLNPKFFYVSILTSPTTGGVTASFGMLGDVIIAEPNAYIAFAGKRVIEDILKTTIPEGSQESEYLFEKGLFDLMVPRNLLKGVLSELFQLHGFLPLNPNSKNANSGFDSF